MRSIWLNGAILALPIDVSSHSQRATAALQRLVEVDPVFGSLSLWCRHRDATPEMIELFHPSDDGQIKSIEISYDIAPAYTDGRTIFYGRKFEEWNLDQQMAVCAHEILHIAFCHIPRGKALSDRLGPRYSPLLFNITTDALINETLAQADYNLPEPCVRLAPILKKILGSKRTPIDALAEFDAEKLYVKILEAIEANDSVSQDIWQLLEGPGIDLWPSGVVAPDERIESAEWEQRVRRAFASSRSSGRGIGRIAHRLGDVPKSRTPWEVVLRRLVTKAVTRKPTPTYERPTRRWLALDAEAQRFGKPCPGYEPGARMAKDLPRVVVCLDVSGSISTLMLMRFAGEIAGIGNRTGAEIHLVVFDDGIHLVAKLDGVDFVSELKRLEFNRGGGTSFIEPVERAMELDPSAIVVLTDLMGPFGDPPRDVPVFWACPIIPIPSAPFGRVISVV